MLHLMNFVQRKEAEILNESWSQSHAGGWSSSNTRADLNVRLPPTPSPESKHDKILLSNDTGGSRSRGNLNQPLNQRYNVPQQPQLNITRNYYCAQPYSRQPYANGKNVYRYSNTVSRNSPNQNRESSCEFALPGNVPVVDPSARCYNGVLPPSPESPLSGNLISPVPPTSRINRNDNARSTCAYKGQNNILPYQSSNTTYTTSPTSTNARGVALSTYSVPSNQVPGIVHYNESQPPLNFKNNINTQFHAAHPRQPSARKSLPSAQIPPVIRSNLNSPVLSSLLSTVPTCNNVVNVNNVNNNVSSERYPSYTTPAAAEQQVQNLLNQQEPRGASPVLRGLRLNSTGFVLDTVDAAVEDEIAIASKEVDTLVARNYCNDFSRQLPPCPGGGSNGRPLANNVAVPHCSNAISPTSNIVTEMKYETQSGPPTAPPHLTSSGVEPPHSSQGSGIVVGGSPTEVVGVDSLLLSSWATNGSEFLEGGVPDAKQTAAGYQDWDSLILGSTATPSLVEMKPLPPFTNYTANLQINGISGHHYHAIASSGQRSSIPSASPTPSSNQEYYESSVVSSSTPCPQASQKQQQQQQQQQNHQQQQQQHHHHHHNQHQQQPQQQQQLPQSTQPMDYGDIDDIAEIIGSAIADTTVPGNGNGPSSEQDPEKSTDWIDIADWINTDCSPKTQETTSPSSFASQIYVTTTPSAQTQSHAGSTLQSLLTQSYAPMLQARLQAGTVAGIQNASCGETPSSTSPYPPLSPPNRVSTSCSPDEILHSSFPAPSHPRKRSRSSPASGQNPAKKGPIAGAAALQYGTESGLIGGKEKTVHRCTICNRGFLNKSNIKVHLRTHTGEKPFKCDVCHKAFRQKAHLIKHQQIHKRIGRD